MSKKRLAVDVRVEFLEMLDAHLAQIGVNNRSRYITDAIAQRVEREGATLPAAAAPTGVTTSTRKNGWRSRLYRDRYQFVAVFADGQWQIDHMHNVDLDDISAELQSTVRADVPYPFECYVYAPDADTETIVAQLIQRQNLFDAEG